MRVLLAVVCLVAVFSQDQASEIRAGAKSGTFLNELQTEMIVVYEQVFPDGQSFSSEIALGLMTARADLCKITNAQQQRDESIFLGTTCKSEFVKLYNDDPEQCSGVICEVLTDAETFLLETLGALIAADTDDQFFDIIEETVINPAMDYSCRCLMKMLGAWINCKQNIGEAGVWDLLINFGGVDTSADYLGGQGWKDFWVNVVVNRVPWNDIEKLFERTTANLCQRNTDIKKGNPKCYTYFYDAFTDLYKVFLKATGKKPAVKKNKSPQDNGVPAHCTTYDLSAFSGMEIESITFGAIKDAVVDKFCVEDCAPLYQKVLLGCCTASMIQDTALEDAVTNVAEGIKEIVDGVSPSEESEEDAEVFDISTYLAYYQDVLEMLRDPTCDDTGVSYDMTPCGEEPADQCAGLKGKQLQKCKKKQPKEEGEEESADTCAGLKGKKLKKCKKQQKGDKKKTSCDGLEGKKLKKCKKQQKGDSTDGTQTEGGEASCDGLQGKKLKKCKKQQKGDSTDVTQTEGGEASCDGLEGKQQKICKKKQKKAQGNEEA